MVGVVYPAGPWAHALIVVLDAPVRSKSNYRRRQQHGQRWGQVQEFEGKLREALQWAVPERWPVDDKSTGMQSRWGVVGSVYARALLDTSNLSKSIYDAAEGVLYFNDAQVRAEASFLDRSRNNNRLVCGFALIEPGTTAIGAQEALEALSTQVLATAEFVKDVITEREHA